MRWPWSRRRDRSVEARARLAEVEGRDAEVVDLGRRLAWAERRNNFSGMVAIAIRRATHEGR